MKGVAENRSENIVKYISPAPIWVKPGPAFIEVSQDDANVIVSKALQLAGQLVVEALAENHLKTSLNSLQLFRYGSQPYLKAFVLELSEQVVVSLNQQL